MLCMLCMLCRHLVITELPLLDSMGPQRLFRPKGSLGLSPTAKIIPFLKVFLDGC